MRSAAALPLPWESQPAHNRLRRRRFIDRTITLFSCAVVAILALCLPTTLAAGVDPDATRYMALGDSIADRVQDNAGHAGYTYQLSRVRLDGSPLYNVRAVEHRQCRRAGASGCRRRLIPCPGGSVRRTCTSSAVSTSSRYPFCGGAIPTTCVAVALFTQNALASCSKT